jgi:hypothetical protein
MADSPEEQGRVNSGVKSPKRRNGTKLGEIRWESMLPVLLGGLLAILGSVVSQVFQQQEARANQWISSRGRELDAAIQTILSVAERADEPVEKAGSLCRALVNRVSPSRISQLQADYDLSMSTWMAAQNRLAIPVMVYFGFESMNILDSLTADIQRARSLTQDVLDRRTRVFTQPRIVPDSIRSKTRDTSVIRLLRQIDQNNADIVRENAEVRRLDHTVDTLTCRYVSENIPKEMRSKYINWSINVRLRRVGSWDVIGPTRSREEEQRWLEMLVRRDSIEKESVRTNLRHSQADTAAHRQAH